MKPYLILIALVLLFEASAHAKIGSSDDMQVECSSKTASEQQHKLNIVEYACGRYFAEVDDDNEGAGIEFTGEVKITSTPNRENFPKLFISDEVKKGSVAACDWDDCFFH